MCIINDVALSSADCTLYTSCTILIGNKFRFPNDEVSVFAIRCKYIRLVLICELNF